MDLHLRDHGSSTAALELPGARVELRGSPEFGHWVVWALKGRDFVCLEPWTCPGDALNTGERLLWLGPGDERSLAARVDAALAALGGRAVVSRFTLWYTTRPPVHHAVLRPMPEPVR